MLTDRANRRSFLKLSATIPASTLLTSTAWQFCPGQESATVNKNRSTTASSSEAVVATVHPLASQAAIETFRLGGNAIDAAVAASLMLSVVDGHNSGLGGGGLLLIRRANGTVHAIDGRETAPKSATQDMFFRAGIPDPSLSQTGPLAAGVPGLLHGLHRATVEFGKLDWESSLLRAAEVAEDGFAIPANYARVLASVTDSIALFPDSSRILLDPNGKPHAAGATLRQPDLANTLRQIASQGIGWFYEGEFARRTADLMRSSGGRLKESDFAEYQALSRDAVESKYRENKVFGFPPPSSGGIHIAQMLGILSNFDVHEIFSKSAAQGIHLLLETMKLAMADRAYWLGDSDFAQVPRGLVDADYLRQRASRIDLSRAIAIESHGVPPNATIELFGQPKHTTHLTTADREGNIVALTQTVNTSFGSKMVVPGTGVFLNNQMDDFSIAPGVRNAFGLVGSEANSVQPGKRPLSSMSPTIVTDNQSGRPVVTCGAAGGPKIITSVLQILVRVLDLGQTIDQAVEAPRVHHQWSPDQAVLETAVPEEVVQGVIDRGHNVSRIRAAAVAQGIQFHGDHMIAASDPRVQSSARGLN
ncbi:MAG: gamma-glutamyltransferase [Planctomycetales bacterium]|nr:gamma-glutamyltransferase [Planctomycetales bacterium]